MEVEMNRLAKYLEFLGPLIGDKRTEQTVRKTVEGIIASQTLPRTQIATFSPTFAGSESAYKRMRRPVYDKLGKRSELSEGQARGIRCFNQPWYLAFAL